MNERVRPMLSKSFRNLEAADYVELKAEWSLSVRSALPAAMSMVNHEHRSHTIKVSTANTSNSSRPK
jgi:hypothetical protein